MKDKRRRFLFFPEKKQSIAIKAAFVSSQTQLQREIEKI
jgi:hypothetical protein